MKSIWLYAILAVAAVAVWTFRDKLLDWFNPSLMQNNADQTTPANVNATPWIDMPAQLPALSIVNSPTI